MEYQNKICYYNGEFAGYKETNMPIGPNVRMDPDVRDAINTLESDLLQQINTLNAKIVALESVSSLNVVEINIKKSDNSVDQFKKI